METHHRSSGVRRILKEARELRSPSELFYASPLEENLFEWHFTIRGPADTCYAGGLYHGRILLPAEYPMKPPNLIMLTPNGRFETNKRICLSISGYHPETWLPSWSIRTALLALIGFMPTHSTGAVGGLDCSEEERRRLAIKSREWTCSTCGLKMDTALNLMNEFRVHQEQSLTLKQFLESEKSTSTKRQQLSNSKNSPMGNTEDLGQARTNISQSSERPLPHSKNNQTTNTDRDNRTIMLSLFHSQIFWIFLFSFLFLILFCRRVTYS